MALSLAAIIRRKRQIDTRVLTLEPLCFHPKHCYEKPHEDKAPLGEFFSGYWKKRSLCVVEMPVNQ